MKAMQPVSIDGIEFDALINQDETFESTVPEYSVENGLPISDTIILNPEKLNMTLYVTNTPVTWFSLHGSSSTRVNDVCEKLKKLYFEKKTVTVSTTDGTYTDMAIESLVISKTVETGYSREIPIKFKKVYVVKSTTTTIPASYGKSGVTAAAAGTANTTKSSSSSGTGSSNISSVKSTGVSSGSTKSKGSSQKSSILYSVASSKGLL